MLIVYFHEDGGVHGEDVTSTSHADSPVSNLGDTLCGAYYGGIRVTITEKGVVTCPECVKIILACKRFSSRKIKK